MTKISQIGRGGGQKLSKLKRKSLGVIAIEVCFTLPVVIYLIFFTIELIKINITQDALQSICEEITYMTIAHDYENGADLIKKGDAIVEKYRPVFIPEKAICSEYGSSKQPVIRWVFETYPMFGQSGDMLSRAPYGGSTALYPNYEKWNEAAIHGSQAYNVAGKPQFLPACGMECPANPEHNIDTADYMRGGGLPNNRVFVLTITCKYPFSSSLVKWLFNKGTNTKYVRLHGGATPAVATGAKGTMYLLWARGAGIVNAK